MAECGENASVELRIRTLGLCDECAEALQARLEAAFSQVVDEFTEEHFEPMEDGRVH